MRPWGRAGLVSMIAATLVVVGAAPGLAEHIQVVTSDPPTVSPADTVEISVVVRSSETQQPVFGAMVVATIDATIVGISGPVEIARATTDERGSATLRWVVRSGATESVVIAYAEAGDVTLESEPLPLVTLGAGRQIVRSESGVSIPGLGAWVLIAILVLTWSLIQLAMLGPVRVALVAAQDEPADPDTTPDDEGIEGSDGT